MRLTIVEQNGWGGLIHYAYQLCTALSTAGHQVTLITARDYELSHLPHSFNVDRRLRLWPLFDPTLEEPPRAAWARAWQKICWETRRSFRAMRLVRAWIELTNHLIAQGPHVVQFGKINFPFEAFFLARLRRRGFVLAQICHEFERREGSGPLSLAIDQLYASVYTHFSAIFFHSHQIRERFHALFEIDRSRTHLIHHGNENLFLAASQSLESVDKLRAHYALSADEPVVVFFGVLSPSKGLPDLIQAFAAVLETIPAKLIIAGYPSKFLRLSDLQSQIDELGLSSQVILDARYLPIPEVASLMELATVVAFPYHSSTQSGSLQIAYTFGRPVIATAVGGLPEVVEDGRSGFLVPPHRPHAMAARIVTLLSDPNLAHQMGEYSRHQSQTKYRWEAVANKLSSVYRELASQKAL